MCIHLSVILSRWCFVIVSEFSYFPVPKTHLPFIQGSPGNAAMPLMDLSAPNGVMLWSFSSSSFNKWMHPSFAFEKFGMGTNGKLTFFCKGFFFGAKNKKHLYIYIYIYFFDLEHTFASPHELYFCSTPCFGEKDSNCRKALKGRNHGWHLMQLEASEPTAMCSLSTIASDTNRLWPKFTRCLGMPFKTKPWTSSPLFFAVKLLRLERIQNYISIMATGQQPGRQSTQIEISNGSDTGSNHFLRDSLNGQRFSNICICK